MGSARAHKVLLNNFKMLSKFETCKATHRCLSKRPHFPQERRLERAIPRWCRCQTYCGNLSFGKMRWEMKSLERDFQSPVSQSIARARGGAEHVKTKQPEEEKEGGGSKENGCQAPPEIHLRDCEHCEDCEDCEDSPWCRCWSTKVSQSPQSFLAPDLNLVNFKMSKHSNDWTYK